MKEEGHTHAEIYALCEEWETDCWSKECVIDLLMGGDTCETYLVSESESTVKTINNVIFWATIQG